MRGFLRALDLSYNKQEITVNLAAAAALYKKLCEATEGYGGAVPVIHQAVAVKAVVDAIDMAFQEDREQIFSWGAAGAAIPALPDLLVAATGRTVRPEAVPGRAGGWLPVPGLPAEPVG